jgi:peptidoglycan/xylan/chitin deacetylase (PgdA/CDA1 family)
MMAAEADALERSAAAWRWAARRAASPILLLMAACTAPTPPVTRSYVPPAPPAAAAPPVAQSPSSDRPAPGALGEVAGRNGRVLIYLPRDGDTLAAVARRFLGSPDLAWQIADANGQRWRAVAGQPVVVPLVDGAPLGVTAEGAQAVPILCYHRFGPGQSKMVVAPAQFEAQLDWLARNHYQVLRLIDVAGFLAGKRTLPQRSVVLTIDDGYDSVYRHAFPLLKKYGFPATLFLYTDFIGSRDGLSWTQLQELADSGLVDIQAHSKSHRNLIEPAANETDVAVYRHNVEAELRLSRAAIERRLGALGIKVRHFAYPFGDANELVLEAMQRQQYELGLTVIPGGNAFFAHPLMLRRTMIYGDHSLDDFTARLQLRRNAIWP